MLHGIDKKLFSCLFHLCFLSFQINFFNEKCVFVNGSSVIVNPESEFRLEIELYNVSIFVENTDKAVQNLFHAIGVENELYWTLKRGGPHVNVNRASFTFGNLHHCNVTFKIAILVEVNSRWQHGFKIDLNEIIAESCSYPLDDVIDDDYTENCVIGQSGKKFHFLKHDGKTYELIRLHNKLSMGDQFPQTEDNSVRLWFITHKSHNYTMPYYVVYENTNIKFAC